MCKILGQIWKHIFLNTRVSVVFIWNRYTITVNKEWIFYATMDLEF